MRFFTLLELKEQALRIQKRYKIQLLSAIKGRARLSSPYWKGNDLLLNDLSNYLETIDEIKSVHTTPLIGTITIQYLIPKEFPLDRILEIEKAVDAIHRKRGVLNE
ncbi:hypothetical protein JCM15457_1944 [Liquorilactobacillus sucicola DSM 21376 = JCM 15457]|uniref:Uncharacterized protein n=1 Tax=Liquorilactobacillus sucicola DSM 21376 = JCM 15457 TaxID=1423806 RepID=A0A023CYT9_9LACO|nr:hypothetical protein [Liquorilactobacillus sucicola]KRN06720.1 hypothetical protein FD15_GL000274 [Liquorilactobacillus sucicola DSM 21376 = JCM 15457]GAJ26989.1 hypothetical protein JCM15457_1944 [Liquorilactobacillus sucicola DSM 21376 = JCM 15457]